MPPVESGITAVTGGTGDAAKPKVGIIYPPPEVRNIVDKTASFVARNGPEFEARIRQNEINNPKFNFLNPADPYHAYYEHKVREFAEGRAQETAGMQASAPSFALAPTGASAEDDQLGAVFRGAQSGITKGTEFVPKEPPADFEFVNDPPSINALDLDIVKLTAQFVARNGRQFLTQLMNREQRNFQFDFLRPQHSLFTYFTKLVEQYTKILIPPKDLVTKLSRESENVHIPMGKVSYRSEWTRWQERQRRREEEAAERERVSYALIDWHDFVVVETVDFQPNEAGNFPPPTTPQEVGARILLEERSDQAPGDKPAAAVTKETTEDMEQSDDEEEAERPPPPPLGAGPGGQIPVSLAAPPPPPPPASGMRPLLPPQPTQMIIRPDYNPKMAAASAAAAAAGSGLLLESPITREIIPVSQVQQHMRIGLLDPKWMEQRDREVAERSGAAATDVFAIGSAVDSSLKSLAERRTDIFGVGQDEVRIGRKLGEADEDEEDAAANAAWDGHSGSRDAATAAAAARKAEQLKAVQDKPPTISKAAAAPQPKPPPQIAAPPPAPPPVQMPAVPPQPPMHMMGQGGLVGQVGGMPVQQVLTPAFMPRAPPPTGAPGMFGMAPPMMHAPALMRLGPGLAPGLAPGGHMVDDDEPAFKKAKTEESLLAEEIFMRQHSNRGPSTVKVVVPNRPDKTEFKLTGQIISLSMPLGDTVAVMKNKLAEELGMPAGKQKLHMDGLFLKDNKSVAFYNMLSGTVLHLQLKERGGRKQT